MWNLIRHRQKDLCCTDILLLKLVCEIQNLWPSHCTIFNLKPSEIARGDKTKNQEQSVPCLSTDLEIWWPWTFEDDADFDALFCFMQTSKFECVIAWIFSSRQGRTAPSKKELVTIERGILIRDSHSSFYSQESGHYKN